jgi:hypothetical protein
LFINALYNWDPAHAPVNITFVESETFGGSRFPNSKQDRAFVSESGPTYAAGPQTRGKRIVEFELDAGGNVLDGPTTLVEYVGTGRASVVGLTAGPDGLYFTDLYKDLDASSPIEAGARVYRVRYTAGGDADFDLDGDVDGGDFLSWQRGFGISSGAQRSEGDATVDGAVNAADLAVLQNEYGNENNVLSTAIGTLSSPPVVATRESPASDPSDLLDVALAMNLLGTSTEDEPELIEEELLEESFFTQALAPKDFASPSAHSILHALAIQDPLKSSETSGESLSIDAVDEVFERVFGL